jgi:signal transduction histidine kinase
VTDSGRGLTREQEASLFEPFCHAGNEAAESNGHFGLGLSVSKRLAQRLGGDLCVESSPGTGCRFVFTFKAGAPSATGATVPERAA